MRLELGLRGASTRSQDAPRRTHRLHQTPALLERLMTWGAVLARLGLMQQLFLNCAVRFACLEGGRRLAGRDPAGGDAEQYTRGKDSLTHEIKWFAVSLFSSPPLGWPMALGCFGTNTHPSSAARGPPTIQLTARDVVDGWMELAPGRKLEGGESQSSHGVNGGLGSR